MKWSLLALLAGFLMDWAWGDPRGIPHPVIWIGNLIDFLEQRLRDLLPATPKGERLAGGILWVLTTSAAPCSCTCASGGAPGCGWGWRA